MPRLFAVPFYHDNVLLSKMSLATFSRLFLAADPNGGQNGAKRTSKSRGAIFGHQKVIMVKRTAKSRGTCIHLQYTKNYEPLLSSTKCVSIKFDPLIA